MPGGICVIFDLDGTLVDTAPDLVAVADGMLAEMRAGPLGTEQGRLAAGQGARALLTAGLKAAGRPLPGEDEWPELVEEFVRRYEARIAELSRPFNGIAELLERCHAAGVAMSVCTNKREALARRLLSELGMVHWFDAIIGGDTVAARKPAPEPVRAALAGHPAEAAFLLGDSMADMQAARAAGVQPLLAAWGYVEEPLSRYGAARICQHPEQVAILLQQDMRNLRPIP